MVNIWEGIERTASRVDLAKEKFSDLPQTLRAEFGIDFGSAACARDMLVHSMSVPAQRQEIEEQCYLHNSGFIKVPILRGGRAGWEWRVNLWPPRGTFFFKDYHEHAWDMHSHCICGVVSEERYSVVTGSAFEVVQSQYSASSLLPHDRVIGNCALRLDYQAFVPASGSYFLPYKTAHRTENAASSIAVTSILRSSFKVNAVKIFRPRGGSHVERQGYLRFPINKVLDILDALGRSQTDVAAELISDWIDGISDLKCIAKQGM